MKRNSINGHLASIWNEIVDQLSLSQYESTMGGDMSYKSKAERAMQVSRNKTVHALCLELINVYDSHFGTSALTVSNRDFSDFE